LIHSRIPVLRERDSTLLLTLRIERKIKQLFIYEKNISFKYPKNLERLLLSSFFSNFLQLLRFYLANVPEKHCGKKVERFERGICSRLTRLQPVTHTLRYAAAGISCSS
jgi:hypothetical protein